MLEQPSRESHWNRLKEALRGRLNDQAYATWIQNMRCLSDDDAQLVLGLPDTFSLDWVSNHYRHVLEEELALLSSDAQLELRLAPGNAPKIAPAAPTPDPEPHPGAPAKPPALAVATPDASEMQMNDRYTFQSFVTGPSNELAAAAAQSVADNPGGGYNPLFVFGRVGLGKTHLIHAIGHQVKARYPEKRVQYQTTEQFVNDVVQGIRFERMDQVREQYRACDVLVIDDIQFIAGKEACQAEFFHTFNALHGSGKQVVVTSDKLPHEIKDLEERIRTRFQWGLIVDLQPPELETRLAIVKKKAEVDAIDLPDDVAMFIAQSVQSNVRELEGCLIRISAYANLTRESMSVDLAKTALKDLLPKKPVLTCDAIVRQVASYFEVKVSDLKSTKRARAIAYPRQVCMYLCRKHTGSSYPEIGKALGGKDHTTALNAFKRIKERQETEPELRRNLDELERVLLP